MRTHDLNHCSPPYFSLSLCSKIRSPASAAPNTGGPDVLVHLYLHSHHALLLFSLFVSGLVLETIGKLALGTEQVLITHERASVDYGTQTHD